MKILSTTRITAAKELDFGPECPFIRDTDVSYYNEFLTPEELKYKQDAKNRTGEVVLMSPNEYFHDCSLYGFPEYVPVDRLLRSRRVDEKHLQQYAAEIKSGTKYFMPYINYADRTQEGLHRMIVVGDLYGWDTKVPVLKVTVFDDEVERYNQDFSKYQDFIRYEIKDICNHVQDDLADWRSPVPDNFPQLFQNSMEEYARSQGFDIDLDVEVASVDGHDRVQIWVTRYGLYSINAYASPDYWFYLEDMYDMGQYDISEPVSDSDSRESDIWDDPDIYNLLFK